MISVIQIFHTRNCTYLEVSVVELLIARPKGGLFRYHVKRIYFTMQGFGFLSAILRQNWWPCTTTTEVPPLFNLARFDLNKDCCWRNYVQTDSDYFSHSICSFINCIGTNNCWFPLARKWPTWKWTWIWILYGKIEKKCPRYFRRDSRGNPRDLNMCRTGRSAALSRGRKSMPPRRESMKLVVQQRKFT